MSIEEGNKKLRKHLIATCLAYGYFGVGVTVQQLGIKAGLSLYLVLGIFISSLIIFAVVIFTSMEKLKDALYKREKDLNQNK